MMNPKRVVVFNHHRVSDAIDEHDNYCISRSALFTHFKTIKESGVPVININNLADASGDFSVALTFDDGYSSDYDIVVPLFEQFTYSAAFFPIVNCINEPGRLSGMQIKQLAEKGFVIGSHGISHMLLKNRSLQEIKSELTQSREVLENMIGKGIIHFAPPYGWYNKRLIQLVNGAGYRKLMTTGLKINTINTNSTVIYRWNITNRTSEQMLKKVLLSGGRLPLNMAVSTGLKQFAKKLRNPFLKDLHK